MTEQIDLHTQWLECPHCLFSRPADEYDYRHGPFAMGPEDAIATCPSCGEEFDVWYDASGVTRRE